MAEGTPRRLIGAVAVTAALAAVLLPGASPAARPGRLILLGVALLFALAWTAALAWRESDRPARARSPAAGAVIVAAVVVAVCWPAGQADFEADDFGYVRLLHDKPLAHFLRLGDISEGIWGRRLDELRPVMAFTYRIDGLLHGVDPARQHLTSLALHVLDAVLVGALVLAVAPRARMAALLAGLVFGLAPVHAEAICWITGKVDPLATAFYLGTAALYARFRSASSGGRRGAAYAAALVIYAVGLLTKEILITLPVLLVAHDVLLAPRPPGPAGPRALLRRLGAALPFFLLAAGLMVLRVLIFGTAARGSRLRPGVVMRFLGLQGEKLLQILAPFVDLVEHAETLAPFTLLAGGALLGALAALLAVLWRARERYAPTLSLLAFFGVGWYALNMAPLVVTYVSARHLYLPSCGVAAALGLLVFPVNRDGSTRTSPARWLCAALALTLNGTLLVSYNEEWIAAGRRSAGIRRGMERAAAALSPGSVVVLEDVPAESRRLMLWRSALPFALQPPFVAADVYASLRVVEHPDLYARPLGEWWRERRGLFRELVGGDPGQVVPVHLARWNDRKGELEVRAARTPRGFLRRQLQTALRRPVESAETLGPAEADRLVRRLWATLRLVVAYERGAGPRPRLRRAQARRVFDPDDAAPHPEP